MADKLLIRLVNLLPPDAMIDLGAGDEDMRRYFILVVSMLLDPAAVLLLLAATRR